MQEKTKNVKRIRVGRIFKTLVLMPGSTKITKTGFIKFSPPIQGENFIQRDASISCLIASSTSLLSDILRCRATRAAFL
jgi:hypothetical protein